MMPIETMPEWMIEQSIHCDDIGLLIVSVAPVVVPILIILYLKRRKEYEKMS